MLHLPIKKFVEMLLVQNNAALHLQHSAAYLCKSASNSYEPLITEYSV